jgi:lipopolysaccharide biosynthesis glycosyltransferase
MQKINIIFTPSKEQQQHLENVLDSIVAHLSIPVQFFLFTDFLQDSFYSKYPIIIKTISNKDLEKCKKLFYKEKRGDIPPFSAYAQIFLPKYFPELDNFLYMEVDQTVRGDLAPLWIECVSKEYCLAASIFLDDYFLPKSIDSFQLLYPNAKMYNTGVFFVNTNKWKLNNFEMLCIEEIELQKTTNGKRFDFYAQGAINNALHKYINEVPWIYNTTGLGHLIGISNKIINNAIVLHWTGPHKPWTSNGLYKDLYYGNPELYNYKDYLDPNPIKTFIKKFFFK